MTVGGAARPSRVAVRYDDRHAGRVKTAISIPDDARVTERLDAVYAGRASETALDETLAALQALSLPDEEW